MLTGYKCSSVFPSEFGWLKDVGLYCSHSWTADQFFVDRKEPEAILLVLGGTRCHADEALALC